MKHNFLIESNKDNLPAYDFCFHMIEACKYKNWYNQNDDYQYYLTDDIHEYDFSDYIPIGSVEFVHKFLEAYYNMPEPKPINIPEELDNFECLKRICYTINKKELKYNFPHKRLVKSIDKIKSFIKIVDSPNEIPNGNYLISEIVDIDSEWRAFIYNDKLVGLNNYSGDFGNWPCLDEILRMIYLYNDSPPAYTLDIGVNDKNGTFLIEVHNFYSCGLYGFADYRILPDMFEKAFRWILK